MADTTSDPLTWQKFFSGIGNIKNFAKIGCYGLNILLIVLLGAGGLFLWNKFFPKKPIAPQSAQTSSITIEKGASIEHLDFTTKTEIKEGPKKVGLEATVSSEDVSMGFVAYLSDHTAIVVGPRWKFKNAGDGESKVLPTVQLHYNF